MKRFFLGFFFSVIISSFVFVIATTPHVNATTAIEFAPCTDSPSAGWVSAVQARDSAFNPANDSYIIMQQSPTGSPATVNSGEFIVYWSDASNPLTFHYDQSANHSLSLVATAGFGGAGFRGVTYVKADGSTEFTTAPWPYGNTGMRLGDDTGTYTSCYSTFSKVLGDSSFATYGIPPPVVVPPKTTVQTPVFVLVNTTGVTSYGLDKARLSTLAPSFTGFDSNRSDTTHVVITNSQGKTLSRSALFDPATQFYVEGQPTTVDGTTYDLNTEYITNYDPTLAPDDYGIDLLHTTVVLPQDTYVLSVHANSPDSPYIFTTTELAFAVNGKNINLSWIGNHWCYSSNGQDCSATPPDSTVSTVYDGSGSQATAVVCNPWDITCMVTGFLDQFGRFMSDLFVPDFGFIGTSLANLNTVFQDKLGFIYYPFTFIGTFLNGVYIASSSPSCTVDFGNLYGLDANYNFCAFQSELPTFFTWAQYALIGTTSFSLMFALNTKLQGVLRS